MTDEMIADKVYEACEREVIRQGFEGDLVDDRTRRLTSIWLVNALYPEVPLELDDLNVYAYLIEPTNGGELRTTPVSFADLSTAIPAANIPRAIENWILRFNFNLGEGDKRPLATRDHMAQDVIKEFLDIHPYSDGNGRLAFILYNWLLGFPDEPFPLPYFYGEAPSS